MSCSSAPCLKKSAAYYIEGAVNALTTYSLHLQQLSLSNDLDPCCSSKLKVVFTFDFTGSHIMSS